MEILLFWDVFEQMSITLNNCQKICVQLNNPGGISPYDWTSTSSSASVFSSGSGLGAIITANSVGGSNIIARDTTGGIVAVFIVTVVSIANQTTLVTSNTVYLASARASSGTVSTSGTANLSGNFATFASGFSANNAVYFVFPAPLSVGTQVFTSVINAFWNRTAANAMSAEFVNNVSPPNTLVFGVVGIGVTSSTPSSSAIDFQAPLVQYATGSQISAFSTSLTLPFDLACPDTSNYICFAQNSVALPSSSNILVSNVQNVNQIKVGWNAATTDYAFSYAIFTKGIRNAGGSFVLYSDVITASLTNVVGNEQFTINLDTAIPTTAIWLVQIQSTSISNVATFGYRISGSLQPTTTSLTIYYANLSSGVTTPAQIGIVAFSNLNSAITMSA